MHQWHIKSCKNWEVRAMVCVEDVYLAKLELCFKEFPSLYDSELELARREIHTKVQKPEVNFHLRVFVIRRQKIGEEGP